jgi:ribosomal protein S18 acetylase RimI-like enzyme
MPPEILLRPMVIADHAEAHHLWCTTPGIGLTPDDQPAALARLLARNPGLSQVACQGPRLVGTILCSHDGRRGMLYHLGVVPALRGQGVGSALVAAALAGLAREGILKCNLLVYADNAGARAFYQRLGWSERTDLVLVQTMLAPGAG